MSDDTFDQEGKWVIQSTIYFNDEKLAFCDTGFSVNYDDAIHELDSLLQNLEVTHFTASQLKDESVVKHVHDTSSSEDGES